MKSILFLSVLMLTSAPLLADDDVTIHRDRVYHRIGERALALDLYLPKADAPTPLVMWIHGGGWRGGNKRNCPVAWLTEHGYAVASINYRLSGEATHPAQVHDCKAALVALRHKAATYNIDPDRIAVAGSSAGGHLSALLGTSAGVADLRGDHLPEVSDRVAAVVDFCGPADLTIVHRGAVSQMLGGEADEKAAEATMASPITHVDASDPPFLIVHGSDDPVVPLAQSTALADKLEAAGVKVELKVLAGVGHGAVSWVRRGDEGRQAVVRFLNEHLR